MTSPIVRKKGKMSVLFSISRYTCDSCSFNYRDLVSPDCKLECNNKKCGTIKSYKLLGEVKEEKGYRVKKVNIKEEWPGWKEKNMFKPEKNKEYILCWLEIDFDTFSNSEKDDYSSKGEERKL